MSRTKVETTKLISMQTMVSSFVGIMAAVPLAFALASPMNASAETGSVTMADLEKFAYVLGQGQQASLANVTTGAATVCTEDAVVKAGADGDKAGATVVLGAFNGGGSGWTVGAGGVLGNGGGFGKAGGNGGVLAAANGNGNGKLASSLGSYYHYSNTVNNSSSVSSVNSNNHVGSHNATTTEIEIEDSRNIMLGVNNQPTAVQNNASESFNEDSYNTMNVTKTEIDNTNTSNSNNTTNTEMTAVNKTETTNVDVDVNRETTVNKNENSNNTSSADTHIEDSFKIDAELEVEVEL